jgi:hypothetical protein
MNQVLQSGTPRAPHRQLTCNIGSNAGREQNRDKEEGAQPNVRFASEDEETDPLDESKHDQQKGVIPDEEFGPEAHEQIRNLAMSLQKSRLQENRMANFAYEPVSMPPSRVCR